MRKLFLTTGFVLIGFFCTISLFMDIQGLIDLTHTQFVAIAIFGIANAFVYSELVFNNHAAEQDKIHKEDRKDKSGL
jgi:mannose/fructose/N-acetylgalactosamine-specific phosphotransferase system component IIC